MNRALYKVVYFPLSTGSVNDLYRGLAFGLGEEPKTRKVDLFLQIQQAVTASFHERKVTPVFILDEMQMAKDVFLSDLNLLFNFVMDSSNPYVLLLCGFTLFARQAHAQPQPPLGAAASALSPGRSADQGRGEGLCRSPHGAGRGEAPDLRRSGHGSAGALHQGPRLINKLAVRALLLGFQRRAEQIDADIIRAVTLEHGF